MFYCTPELGYHIYHLVCNCYQFADAHFRMQRNYKKHLNHVKRIDGAMTCVQLVSNSVLRPINNRMNTTKVDYTIYGLKQLKEQHPSEDEIKEYAIQKISPTHFKIWKTSDTSMKQYDVVIKSCLIDGCRYTCQHCKGGFL